MLLTRAGIIAAASAAVTLTTPTFVSASTVVANGATASTAVSPAFPASGVALNDIAILSLHGDNHSTMAVPGDWTPCGAQEDTSGSVSARLWWKRCAGTESGTTVACTRGTGATGEWFGGIISIWRSCQDTGTPFEGYSAAQNTTTTVNGPAITTTGEKRLAVHIYCIGDDTASTPPAGYTEVFEQVDTQGNDGAQVGETQSAPTATTIAAVTRTIGVANPSVGFGLALLPASGAPPSGGAITRTHLNQATVSGASVGVSVTPAANSLLLVTVGVRRNTVAASAIACTDNAGTGNTYTDTVAQGGQLGTNGVRLAKMKCRMGASPGTFTITATSASATSMGISVEQFVDASDDLSNVSPMVFNSAADMTCVLPSAPSAANIVIGSYVVMGSSANTLPSGHTSIVLMSPAGARVETSYANITNTSGSWSSANADGVGCLIEIKQA